jgi:hypothetical protein
MEVELKDGYPLIEQLLASRHHTGIWFDDRDEL